MPTPNIESLEHESRVFPPPSDFAARAVVGPEVYDEAATDPTAWWAEQARTRLTWDQPFSTVLDDSNPPFYRWFTDGTLNASANCVDRHAALDPDRIAIRFEGEPGDRQEITYSDLLERVSRLSNVLLDAGVKRGERVAIYMGMVPELVVSMLACARIGAAHTVVFGGFAPEALKDRIIDCDCVALLTQDEGWRAGNLIPLKANADKALEGCPGVHTCLVVKRTGGEVGWVEGRDRDYADAVAGASAECPAEPMDAEQVLFILYTSGTTGKPKGVTHTTGGYLTGAATTYANVFDHKPEDVFWCSADCGWVTGHTYIVYGPLANGATQVIYEGAPNYPERDRWWDVLERHRVSVFYTAPTAIRTFMKWGDEWPDRHDLSSLRLLGTVGEAINPEAWMWYRQVIGGERCPIVDTWWQTETGAIMISPLPGARATKPGSAGAPLPGVSADIVDEEGKSVQRGHGGYLVLTKPWPSMMRTLWGDPDRYVETYWSRFPGLYLAGDGARQDDDGDFWLLGRIDDVMNVSGHRLSTIEVESALVGHPSVAEAAVVGRADERTGQAIAAFVTLRGNVEGGQEVIDELRNHVATSIGPIAKPASIVLTDDLPKTRSGKIMRRLLKDISEDRRLGDVTTLANADVVNEISDKAHELHASGQDESSA
jgi:acetyl-CoA synthetase